MTREEARQKLQELIQLALQNIEGSSPQTFEEYKDLFNIELNQVVVEYKRQQSTT